jgi:CheY-like chemotaxis protein
VQKFDINEIAKEVAELMKGIAAKSIIIKTVLPESPMYILGDPGQIHQCVLNLCMNAKDVMGDDKGSITIRVQQADGKDGHVWIQVDDTGSGISPDIIDKIFDPFFTTKKKTGGTGLGLSVVYGIIKAHKGTILVDSRPGEGTTFTIELPGFVEEGLKPPDGRKTIIVLDDDDIPRTYCMEILRRSGYKAIDFSNVKETVEWLRNNPDELWFVISDVVMPDMDINKFLQTCQELKNDFTCVWMSGYVTPEIEKLTHKGIFLKKPFTPTDLIETIKSLTFD